jgi:hypothetical protein
LAPTATTEPNLHASGSALQRIEDGFKQLRPNMPMNSNILISAQFGGDSAPYYQLYRFQPHRVWYWDPTLFVLHPHGFRGEGERDLLFWITPRYEVFEIDLESFRPRTSGPAPTRAAFQKALRRYAVGRAAAGRTEEGVRILASLDAEDAVLRVYDWRLAGALWLADGNRAAADTTLQGLPEFPREAALDFIMTTLAEDVPGLALDDAMMLAFGLAPDDLAANRSLMRGFERYGWTGAARRFARRVLALNPEDPDAARLSGGLPGPGAARITVPVPHE